MPQEIRVVGLLPDENQVRGGHEVGDERAAARGTGERIGADAEPATVVGAVVFRPELLVGEELLVEKASPSRLEAAVLHAKQASRSRKGQVPPRSCSKAGPVCALTRTRPARLRRRTGLPDPVTDCPISTPRAPRVTQCA